jgi:hypothetical protein
MSGTTSLQTYGFLSCFLQISSAVLLALGGMTENIEYGTAVQMYIPTSGNWMHIGNMPPTVASYVNPAVASFSGDLFIAGGLTNNVVKFSLATRMWTCVSPMTTSRSRHALVALRNALIAFGGTDRAASSSSERYDPATNKWHLTATLCVARYRMAACEWQVSWSLCGHLCSCGLAGSRLRSATSPPSQLFWSC